MTLKRKIHIFTRAVSRKNGGSSSIVDLANGFVEINKEVVVYTQFGFLDKYIYKPTYVNDNLNISVLDYNVYKKLPQKQSLKKLVLNKLLGITTIFQPQHIQGSIVIDAIGLPFNYINKLQNDGCKIVLNHAGSPNAFIKFFGLNGAKRENLKKATKEYLEMIRQYDYILFQSSTQAKKLCDLAKWHADKTLVLTPGVNEDGMNCIKKQGSMFEEGDFNVVIVGSVQQRKGQHLLSQIAKKIIKDIANIKFHIVGNTIDEKYKERVEEDIRRENLKDVILFYGFKDDYLSYMSSADVILQVSEEEGVSRILREAMFLQKIIISFKLDGTNDLLEDGNDSLLCPYGDLHAIAKNILYAYRNQDACKKLSLRANENFLKKYSKKEYLKNLDSIIQHASPKAN